MSKAKKYTIETLLPLNVSYDSDHGLTQEDVDMVNSLVEVIESTRSRRKFLYGLTPSLIPYTEILRPRIGRNLHCVNV